MVRLAAARAHRAGGRLTRGFHSEPARQPRDCDPGFGGSGFLSRSAETFWRRRIEGWVHV